MENQNYANDFNYDIMKQSVILQTDTAKLLAAVNTLLSIVATLGNVLILIALHKVSTIHSPTKLLFRCLAVTDLCVGTIVQPLFIPLALDSVFKPNIKTFISIYLAQSTVSYMLCVVSFLTATAIGLDRLLALKLGIRYKHVVNVPRVKVAVFVFSFIAVSCGLTYSFWDYRIAWIQIVVFIVLWVFTSVSSYVDIMLTLRKQQLHVQETNDPLQSNSRCRLPLNIPIYKKTVAGIAWVQLALGACYLPYIISIVITITTGWSGKEANALWMSGVTFVYFNSSINPVLYCWKMKKVRRAVKVIVLQICCCHGYVCQLAV